jgi:hypothetical protein
MYFVVVGSGIKFALPLSRKNGVGLAGQAA